LGCSVSLLYDICLRYLSTILTEYSTIQEKFFRTTRLFLYMQGKVKFLKRLPSTVPGSTCMCTSTNRVSFRKKEMLGNSRPIAEYGSLTRGALVLEPMGGGLCVCVCVCAWATSLVCSTPTPTPLQLQFSKVYSIYCRYRYEVNHVQFRREKKREKKPVSDSKKKAWAFVK
jgi:hypothetical protein